MRMENEIIKGIKSLTTREIGESVFQASFYDHIIRNEDDYVIKAQYIENNPAKWRDDKYYNGDEIDESRYSFL
mgnify:CR=1 FL=1